MNQNKILKYKIKDSTNNEYLQRLYLESNKIDSNLQLSDVQPYIEAEYEVGIIKEIIPATGLSFLTIEYDDYEEQITVGSCTKQNFFIDCDIYRKIILNENTDKALNYHLYFINNK